MTHMKQKFRGLILALSLVLASLLFIRATDDYFEISKNLDIFASLYREINTHYVDETKPGNLMKIGIDAMLRALDPYTNFIPESQIEDLRFMTTGQYGGIGAWIQKRGDIVLVTETYDDFPAQKAGILIGDRILEIDGKSIEGKNTGEISDFLKGQPSTKVRLKVERDSEDKNQAFDFEIERAEITIKNVPHSGILQGDAGYIKLSGFTQSASDEFGKALAELRGNEKVKGLIVDLRGNGGGLLKESVSIVNNFVPKGTEVVKTKGKLKEWDQSHKAMGNPVDLEIPIVVLVDHNSASASEIVAGSLQDLDRAVVIGTETYGKGLVQQTVDLSYNSKLKVTVAKYYTPSGRCIQKVNYADREENGMVHDIPDSLIHEFKSLKYGRRLFDGKGITPDIIVADDTMSNISAGLLNDYLIFDFATAYRLRHKELPGGVEYKVSEEVLGEFKEFISSKKFKYSTKAEKYLDDLKRSAEQELYYGEIEEQYELLHRKLGDVKGNDFEKHSREISTLLSSEIVLRYYNQKGQLVHSLSEDPCVKEALAVLHDATRYQSVLTGGK